MRIQLFAVVHNLQKNPTYHARFVHFHSEDRKECIGFKLMYSSDPPIIDNNLCVYDYKYVYDSKTKDLYYLSSDFEFIVLNKPLSEKMGIKKIEKNMKLHCVYAYTSFSGVANIYKETYIPYAHYDSLCYDLEIINNRFYISKCKHSCETFAQKKITKIEKMHHQNNKLENDAIPPVSSFKNTKTRVFGIDELQKNAHLLLKITGLESMYEHIFTFVTQIRQISYDIETHLAKMSEINDIYHENTITNIHKPLAICLTALYSKTTLVKMIQKINVKFTHFYVNSNTFRQVHRSLKKMDSNQIQTIVNQIIHTQYDYYTITFTNLKEFFLELWCLCDLIHVVTYILIFEFLNKINHDIFIVKQLLQSLKPVFSSFLIFGYNSQKYDNVLLETYMLNILISLKLTKIRVLKKGKSVKFIRVTIPCNRYVKKTNRKAKFVFSLFPLTRQIIFRDIKDIIGAGNLNSSLKSYGLELSKFFFPYKFLEMEECELQNISCHNILDKKYEKYWYDNLQNKTISIEKRKEMQTLLKDNSLMEYLILYLEQDTKILHKLVICVHKTFLDLGLNYVLCKKYTVSQISFYYFFTLSKINCIDHICNVDVKNDFYNYFMQKSIIGGFCASHCSGEISEKSKINALMPCQNLDKKIWPSYDSHYVYDKHIQRIVGYDIRSLYAAAFLQGSYPVFTPCIFARKDDNLELTFKKGYASEYFAVMKFLDDWKTKFQKNDEIVCIRHSFTTGGQIRLNNSFLDACIISKTEKNHINFSIFQYQSSYFHGHIPFCPFFEKSEKYLQSLEQEYVLKEFMKKKLVPFYALFNIKCTYTLYYRYDCFHKHRIKPYKEILPHWVKKSYNKDRFVDLIKEKKLRGFIMVKDLRIRQAACYSGASFCINRFDIQKKHLSNYTLNKLSKNIDFPHTSIIATNAYPDNSIIHTDLFNWLNSTFQFENNFTIEYAIMYEHKPFLKETVSYFLSERKKFKDLLLTANISTDQKVIFEQKSSAIKIIINSGKGIYILQSILVVFFKKDLYLYTPFKFCGSLTEFQTSDFQDR